MIENIEKYYIVPISILQSTEIDIINKYSSNKGKTYKFACVKVQKQFDNVYYVDFLNGERYKYGIDFYTQIGDNFIKKGEKLIPLNLFLRRKKLNISTVKLVKLVKEILFEMNREFLNSNELQQMDDIYCGVVAYDSLSKEPKTLKCGNTIVKYKEV